MILSYHQVDLFKKSIWYVSVDAFFRQMHDLTAYDVVALDDYDPRNPKHVAVTFEGVYSNVAKYALPILREFGYPFELFVIGEWIGRDNTFDQHVEPPCAFASMEELKGLCNAGGRIQWHTRSHKRLDAMSADEAARELAVPDNLRQIFPPPNLEWFAYPHGVETSILADKVRSHFKGALACDEGNVSDRYRLPRTLVLEDASFRGKTVSVIVANYNYGQFLTDAIESVEGQTIPPDEFLIIDDASSDHSSDILARYEGPARIIVNEQNLGIVENFRKAVASTSGDYIVFLGADNRMRSDYLEKTLPILNRDERVGIVYTDMLIFDKRSHILAAKVGAERVDEDVYYWRFPDPTEAVLEALKTRNVIHGSSIYRRRLYNKVGGYLKTDQAEDHNLFSRMVASGARIQRIPEPLIEYRQHSPSQANSVLALEQEIAWYRLERKRLVEANAALSRALDTASLRSFLYRKLVRVATRYPGVKAVATRLLRAFRTGLARVRGR